jgi:hypothetical protein
MPSWEGFDRFPGLVCILPFWLPYGFILLRLYGGRVKSGLALAVAMGCALIVPGILLVRFVIEWERSWWIQGNLTLALLMQPVLVIAGILTYRSIPHSAGESFKPWGSSAYGIVLFGLCWLLYTPVPRQIIDNELHAMGRLREITNANLSYAEKFDGFYPESSSLQEPGEKVECDSNRLSYLLRRNPVDGYIFEYRSAISNTQVRGCKVAKSYTITARPIGFRKSGIRSFFVDQGKPGAKQFEVRFIHIHHTSEDRPATPDDPTEDVELFFTRYAP